MTSTKKNSHFEHNQSVRNFFALRLAAILTIALVIPFWALDWFIIPDHLWASAALRLACGTYAVVLLFLIKKQRRWVVRNVAVLESTLTLSIIWAIAAMCWMHTGYESPYYAGMNTVLIVVGMMFSWNLRTAINFQLLVYGFYMAPLAFGLIPIHELAIVVNNQFFLVTTMLLTVISQQHRVKMEEREFNSKKTLKTYLTQVRKAATTDSLTDLFNRRQLLAVGEREYMRCIRHRRNFSAIMVDIDFFKKINDNHSHRAGDEVIQRVAKLLKSAVRTIDVVGRYGGEEFLIFLPETDSPKAMEFVGKRIQEKLRENPLSTSVGPLTITVSMGVSSKNEDRIDLATLVHQADLALYEAKHSGRNRITRYDSIASTRAA